MNQINEEPENGSTFRKWRRKAEVKLSPRSVELYEKGLTLLFERMGRDIEEYGTELKKALKKEDLEDLDNLVLEFQNGILKLYSKYSESYTSMSFKAFISWAKANRFGLDFEELNGFRKLRLKKKKLRHIKTIPKEDISKLIQAVREYGRTPILKTRNIALIHFLKDTGLARDDLIEVNYGDVRECLESNSDWCMLLGYRQKTGRVQAPTFGPETMEALREYIEVRKAPRDYWTKVNNSYKKTEIPGEILKDDTPLFIFTLNGVRHKYGDRINEHVLTDFIKKASQKIGKQYSPHGFRSYNWLKMESGGMPKNWLCLLQGRSISDSSEAYTLRLNNPDHVKKLMAKYQEVYHELAISKEGVEREVDQLKEKWDSFNLELVQKENEDLKAEMVRQRAEMVKLAKLVQQLVKEREE